jgi:hypothetical protein
MSDQGRNYDLTVEASNARYRAALGRRERSPEEIAAQLAELERRIAALPVFDAPAHRDVPGVVDLDDLGGDAA